MSLFSKKTENRRRRAPKKSESQPWFKGAAAVAKPKRRKSGDIVGQVYELNAQIGVIENFLAQKTAEHTYREQMRRDGLIPPPDRNQQRRNRKKKDALSHAERRRYHAERSKNGLHFLLLFCLACGLIWWLLNSGI